MSGFTYVNVGLLIAAEAYYFFLEKKVAKIQDSANASFAAQAFARIRLNHGTQEFAAARAPTMSPLQANSLPSSTTQARIVLPDLSGSRPLSVYRRCKK